MSEKELVARAQAGDFDAFSALVTANKTKIYALAVKMTGNSEDADDVVQDTLVKAIDNIEHFRGESSFGTWLYSIALNQTRALLSKKKQTDLKPIEEYLPSQPGQSLDEHNNSKLFDWKDPHAALEDQELKEIIDRELAALPYKYREAFLLKYYEELPIKEIAKIINESVASTKSRVLRARLALRERLAEIFEEQYG